MVNSKAKGNTFERKIAKILTKKLDMEFNRVPSSGGLRWTIDNNIYGDIVTPEEFPFIIECKCRENWSFDQLMKGNCKEFDSWRRQVDNDCERYEENTLRQKYMMIIFTKNHMPIYVAIPYDLYYQDKKYFCDLKRDLDLEDNYLMYKNLIIRKMKEKENE